MAHIYRSLGVIFDHGEPTPSSEAFDGEVQGGA